MGDAAHLAQLGQERDDKAAARWYRLAAEQDPVAAWHLGSMAEAGEGMPQDTAMAMKWYRQAAAKDEPDALFRLAEVARDGRLARPSDAAEAERLFRRGGRMASRRPGDPGCRMRNRRPRAMRRLQAWREAADRAEPAAFDRLGRAYRDGELGLAVDDAEAGSGSSAPWIRAMRTATLDMARCCCSAAAERPTRRARWRCTAERRRGSTEAEAKLGGVYWVGAAGIAKDRAEAVRHYQIAAHAGNVVAERMLAVAYGTGDGVARDEAQQLALGAQSGRTGRCGVAEYPWLSDSDRGRRDVRLR